MDESSANQNPEANTPSANEQKAAQENALIMGERLRTEQPATEYEPPRPGPEVQQTTPAPPSPEIAGTEHRQAYGTARTENLRDSGWWRLALPAFVLLLCAALFAVPLIILIPLFVNSLDPAAYTHNLVWLWIVMIIIEVAVAITIIRGLIKIFMTQAGNYRG